jgi:PKD repeat protein
MTARIINVATAAELKAALASATGGETLLLKAGNYGNLEFTAKQGYDLVHSAATPVTIRSADASKPAVFTGLDMRDATGFSFENLKFDYTYSAGHELWYRPFSVSDSNHITVRGCTFDGDLAQNRNSIDNGYGFAVGFTAAGSDNLTFEDNTIYKFYRGATFGSNDNLVVAGNEIHSVRMDGMNFSAVQGARIEDNYLHDFKRSLQSSDHADMIQFFTNGSSRPSTDVVIRGNRLDIGGGDHTQSIFMRNEEVDNGRAGSAMFYRNVLIEDNTIYNDHMHGITVGEAAGLTIRNNAVLHANGGDAGLTGKVSIPLINVAKASTGVTIADNLTGGVTGNLSGTGGLPSAWTVTNNLKVQDQDQSAANHYSDLFLSTTLDASSPVHNLLALPGGLIETRDVGSSQLRIDGAPAKITPLFHVSTLPADDSVFVFDAASHSFGRLGTITPDLGTFVWNFGDGTTATGGVVTHSYAAPGRYVVKLSVVQPDGTTASISDTVARVHPDLLRFDYRTGSFGVIGDSGEKFVAISSSALSGTAGAWTISLGALNKVTASVAKERLEDLFGADNFALDLRLKADLKAESYGEVFRLHNTFIGSVNKTGQFVFQLTTENGKTVTLTSTGANILDGNTHNISIRFDADLGFLKLAVDGKTAVSVPVTADLPAMGSWNLNFGNPWGARNFDGKLSRLDLNVERSDYPVYVGGETPTDGRATAATVIDIPLPDTQLADTLASGALRLDDYVLDGVAIAALRDSALRGDTHRVIEEGRTVLAFDGEGDQAVLGRLAVFEPSDRLAISVAFQREAADGSVGRLIANPGQILMAVHGNGLRLNVATADAGMTTYKLGGLGVNDTDWHKAVVILDSVADRLQVFFDNEMVLDDQSHDFVMQTPEGVGRGWIAGTGFDGQIAEIRIDDDIAPLLENLVGSDSMAFI